MYITDICVDVHNTNRHVYAWLFADEKKRKSKWDAMPTGLPSQPQRGGSGSAPNLTSSATGTRATIISAVGTLTKKNTFNIINTTGPSK